MSDLSGTDPFADIDPQMAGVGESKLKGDDPFADLNLPAVAHNASGIGSFFGHAASGVLPMAGGMAAAGAGAEAGAAIGALGGPFGSALGGIVGGLGGFFAGSAATEGAQDFAIHQMPDNWQESIGQSDRQKRMQEQQHPYASFLGGIAPYALTMSPGAFATRAAGLPADATAFQRLMANPLTARAMGGGMMGGLELGQEELNGESPDWVKIGVSTGFGMVFNKPTTFGEYLTHAGAAPIAVLRGKPPEPTVAQTGDLGVMGPGITESTFHGGTEQSDATKTSLQNAAADEQAAIGPVPDPDTDAIARRMHPELFAENDRLIALRDSLRQYAEDQNNPPDRLFDELDAKKSEVETALSYANPRSPDARNYRAQLADIEQQRTELQSRRDAYGTEGYVPPPDVMLARQHLVDTEHALWDIAPDVAAARRRAADHAGQVEEPAAVAPEAVAEAPAATPKAEEPPPRTIEQQRAFITQDRTAQLMAAGMSREHAEASAHVDADYYVTLAHHMGGKLGTAEDLYHQLAERVVGPDGRGRNPTSPTALPASRPIAKIQSDEKVSARKAAEIQKTEAAPVRVLETVGAEAPAPVVTLAPVGLPWAREGEKPRIPDATEMKAAGIKESKFKATQEEAIGRLADWQAAHPEERYRRASAPAPAAPAPAPVAPTPEARPRLRTAKQIMDEDKVGPSKVEAIQEAELEALSNWQRANAEPRAPRIKRNHALDLIAHNAGLEVGATPEQIVDALPAEKAVEEVRAEAEAGDIEFREAEAEAAEVVPEVKTDPDAFYDADQSRSLEELEREHRPAEDAVAAEQRPGGGGESAVAAEHQGQVSEGGGSSGRVDGAGEGVAGEGGAGSGGAADAGGPAGSGDGGTGGDVHTDVARPSDAHGNPIFKQGERVTIPEGEHAGRHGEVTEAAGIVMQSILGNSRTATFYTYKVRTDGGLITHATKLEPETGEAPHAIPDPVYQGHAIDPKSLKRSIAADKSGEQNAKGAEARARTQTSKQAHRQGAADARAKAAAKQAVLDAWTEANPDEAARLFPTAEPAAPTTETPAASGMSLVETRHTKTGDKLFVVTQAAKVGADEFTAMKATAKQNGGYYSSFRGAGAVPGWTFKTREGAEGFMRAHGGEAPVAVAATAPPAPRWTEIGKNENGYPVHEDKNGVRSYVRDGIRITEPVAMILDHQGVRTSAAAAGQKERAFRTEAENAAKAAPSPEEVATQAGATAPEPMSVDDIRSVEQIMAQDGVTEAVAMDTQRAEIDKFIKAPHRPRETPADRAVTDAIAPAQGKGPAPVTSAPKAEAAPKPEAKPTPEPLPPAPARDATGERPANWGANNKLVSREDAEAIRARLRAKSAQLRSGIDPEMMLDGARLAVFHIEAGARKFSDYAAEMVKDLGAEFRPYLRSWYESARHWPGMDASEMSPHAEADAEQAKWSNEAEPNPLTDEDRADADKILDAHQGDAVIQDIANDIADGKTPDEIADRPGMPFTEAEITGIADALDRRGEIPDTEADDGVQESLPPRDAGAGAEDVQRTPPGGEDGSTLAGQEPGSASDVGGNPGAVGEGREGQANGAGGAGGGGNRPGASDRVSDTGARAEPGAARRPPAQPDAGVQGQNFTIEPGALAEGRGAKQKARDNLAAIELAKQLIKEGRPATKAEQAILVKYVGWGGLKGAFKDSAGQFTKGMEDIGARLREILNDEEYKTAEASISNAHYTAEHIIRSMWEAVRKMGFDGGSVFEPGMGVGHFLGLMPPDIAAKSHYQGIEKDHLTAGIAKLLYPESGVRQADYTRMALPENAFDLVIGNPPFADVVIQADPKYRARGFMLHDYFFAKSLDSVRPGGLMGFVTSAGTMNKLDTAAREYLAERAEFVGGVRLPSSAFRRNAMTDVTTDVLFFKRRMEGQSALGDEKPDWTQTVVRSLPNADGETIEGNVNRYFSEHPENVLGREGFFDKLYQDRYAVHDRPGADLPTDFRAALDRLPSNIMEDAPTPEQRAALDFTSTERKDGSFYVAPDGELMQYRDGAGQAVAKRGKGIKGGFTAEDVDRIHHLIPMRDALRDVFAADLARNDEAGAEARIILNEHYDRFVAKFGPINKAEFEYRRPTASQIETARLEAREEAREMGESWDDGDFDPSSMIAAKAKPSAIAKARQAARDAAAAAGREFNEGSFDPEDMQDNVYDRRPNIKPFMADPESYRLRSIESYNDATGEATKKRIFSESVLKFDEEPEIKSANDGVLWSMNKLGRFDVDAIAAKMGRNKADIIGELGDAVYKVPGTNDTYQTRDEYLSGDIVAKLETARAQAENDPDVRRNIAALEAAMPPPLPPSAISMNLGMPWIPSGIVREFVRDHLDLGEPYIKHSPATGTWLVNDDSVGNAAGVPKWGVGNRDAYALLSDAMNRTPPRIYVEGRDEYGKKISVFDKDLTQAAQDKVDAMKSAFTEWVHADPGRADALASLYNDTMNRNVLRQYDGSYLTTPGVSADWKWRPHQQRVVARIVQSGNTYMAHSVGAGKTSAMIGAGMEMRRLGLVKKPLYIVPNHMLGQFTKEFYEQYPTARIAVADEERFHTDRRRQFVANVAQDDLDAVIMTHSSFGRIPISDEFQAHLIQEQIDMLDAAMGDLDPKSDRIAVGRIQNQKQKLEQRLLGQSGGDKDQTLTFEQMGCDFLFADEAHLFRKLSFATKQSGLKGISPEGSDMAFDLYSKVRYLESQKPGRSAVFASGTPVTNTMGELYSLSRFMQPEALAERGLTHFDSWAQNFGDTKTGLEENAAGGYAPVTRFGQFVNLPELYKMVGQVMDIVTPKQLEQYVTRPAVKGGERQFHLAPRTPILDAYQASLAARMEAIKARKGPPQKGADILLSVINDGRHAAIDPRFVADTPNDPRSKLNAMIENVSRIYHETADHQFYDPGSNFQTPSFRGPATQMIFANLGVNGRGPMGFSTYQWIKEALRREGVDPAHIAFIGDYKGTLARQTLFNDMNEGKVRVLVGSTQKMGTGVNAQRRLYAVHNLDPLWFPADDEQRVGRILRQGNHNPEIEIHDYSTKGTYDSAMWKMMGNKARFIEQFFRGDPELRNMEDVGEASMYEQASAMATTDERLITLTQLKQDLETARRRESAHDQEQYALRTNLRQQEMNAGYAASRIRSHAANIARREDTRGDAFSMHVAGETFDKRADAATALDEAIKDRAAGLGKGAEAPIGRIGGFPLIIRRGYGDAIQHYLRAEGGEIDLGGENGKGVIALAEHAIRTFEDRVKFAQRDQAEAQQKADAIRPLIGKPFTGTGEIIRLSKAARDLEARIRSTPAGAAEPVPTRGFGLQQHGGEPSLQFSGSDLYQHPVNQTETPAFRNWFGDSKVVDGAGRPLVVYHSSDADFSRFAKSKLGSATKGNESSPGALGTARLGFWFSDHPLAERLGQSVEYPVHLAIEYPKEIRLDHLIDLCDERGWRSVLQRFKDNGYDGLKVDDQEFGGTSYVAFSPTQIKSAIGNRGTFDPTDPNILHQSANAKITMRPGESRSIIRMFRVDDPSTFMHEASHGYLKNLLRFSQHPAASDSLKADAATVRKWLNRGDDWTGFKPNGAVDTVPHEKFARTFEQYLREGVAPSPGLASVFAKFKSWLVRIYQSVKGVPGSRINEDIRGVFDRMLAIEPNRTVHAPEREPAHSLAAIHEADAAETEPHEAESVRDRVVAERDRQIANHPPEIASELTAATRPAADEPADEVGEGPARPGEVDGDSGKPEPVAPSGSGGTGSRPVEQGGGKAVPKSDGVGTGATGAGDRPGPRESSGPDALAPKPADTFRDDADPKLVDLAGNIRVENLTDVDSVAQAIHDSAERNDEFQSVRGGTTKGRMMELANAMGLDPSKLDEDKFARMFGNTNDLGVKILAARKLVVQSADLVSNLMKAAASGTDHDVAALGVAIARHDMIQSALAGVTAEWGRAGSAFHSLLGGWDKAQDINQLLKDNLGRDLYQLKIIAKLGSRMDTPGKVSKLLRDAKERSFGRMILEYWINGLISGLSTHVTYMVGNTILAAEKAGPETAVAAAIGAARSRFGRNGERVLLGEVAAQFRAAGRELPAAVQAALESYRSGVTTMLPGETARAMMPFQGDMALTVSKGMTNQHVTWGEVRADAYSLIQGMRDGLVASGELVKAGGVAGAPLIGRQYTPGTQIPDIAYKGVNVLPLGTLARLPGRNVAAIHSTFRALNYSMEINALAYRRAVGEGLTGTALDARVADLRQNPTPEMMEQARGKATDLTLMGEAGAWVNKLSQWINTDINLPLLGKTPIMKFVDPFVHIAANIMNQSLVQRTPIGLLSSEIRADLSGKNGNVAADTAAAKMLVGSAISVLVGGLAAQGLASGSGPADPDKSAMWRLAGNQAHSIRVGDIWYDVHRLGPLGMLMSVAADMYDVAHQIGKEDADVVGKSLMHAFSQNILDESFMRGPSDLIRALTDPDRYGVSYVRTFLSSFVPYSVGMAQMARASDPYSRQARTIMDAIRAKIPGMSESLFPRRDIWGEPMPSNDAVIAPGITAIYAKQMSTDPVNQTMLSLGIAPAPVKRRIRNVQLTDEQYDEFARVAGRSTKMRLDAIVRNPDFQSWAPGVKHEVIEETLRQSREAARGWMMMKYPEIPREAAQMQIQRRTGVAFQP